MNRSKSLAVTLGLLLAATGTYVAKRDWRSAGPVHIAGTVAPPKFSRSASTGLFVGVREFPHDETLTVPYAVDDAVDLAHRFSLDQRVGLIAPRRVVLALSGAPQKETSKERLRELEAAGARVQDATSGDILNLLNEQAALAGTDGIFVLSIATHGFQQDGDAYILGSTSAFGSPETSLRTATIFDAAARARRSLILIDACRDRIGRTSRGATADPAAAAPHIRKMAKVQGQVILYAAAAGEYAFDDPLSGNGVFTRAVLDGLGCEASAPGGTVVVETLHTYVEREVRRWISDNKRRTVNPATQVSMEGQTRNMPLAECWRPPGPRIHVAIDGSTIRAYGQDTSKLWEEDLGAPILHAEAADLDADSFYEVVVGLKDRIIVFDRDRNRLWSRTGESMNLTAFTTGDLFRKHTNQIVAVWNDGARSRLTVLESDGSERSRLDYAGLLQHVAVGRPSNYHAPKIVVATAASLLVLNPKRLGGKPLWQRSLASSSEIRELRIADVNDDARPDITVSTKRGSSSFTFEGKLVGTQPSAARPRKDPRQS